MTDSTICTITWVSSFGNIYPSTLLHSGMPESIELIKQIEDYNIQKDHVLNHRLAYLGFKPLTVETQGVEDGGNIITHTWTLIK